MAKKTQTTNTDASAAEPPTMRDYAQSIGALRLNFRTYMIRVDVGKYYVEKATIRLSDDGSMRCNKPDYLPPQDIQDLIRGEILALIAQNKWPKAARASVAQFKKLQGMVDRSSILYPCWHREGEKPATEIIMVQERRKTADGGKIYVPWSLYNNEWLPMEPDGALPFYKPQQKLSNYIMVHEGAKAAHAAANVKKEHPWYGELQRFEHWGLLGGALAPHRADYSELNRAAPVEVIYVCDHDAAGRDVLDKFSQHYGGSLKGIEFGQAFDSRPSFDMADPIPKELFGKAGYYIGPTLSSLMRPMTWATEELPREDGDRGRPRHALTSAFKDEWRYIVKNSCYVNVKFPDQVLSEDEFNKKVSGVSHLIHTSRLVKKQTMQIDCLSYNPSSKTGGDITDNRKTFNTFSDSHLTAIKGDAGPWIDYMTRLIPEKQDRDALLKWCATLIARPDIRMIYAVLLISEIQGVGKTTLGEKILAPIIGYGNVSFPTEKAVVDSAFNGWMAHKRLAIIGEIYSGHSWKAYDTLKGAITEKKIEVNQKFQMPYTLDNWLHVLASSNSPRALKIDNADRRWLVPKVTEEKQTANYWLSLNEWLRDGGLGIIKWWASEYVREHGHVLPGDAAPMTARKGEMISDSRSNYAVEVARILENLDADDRAKISYVFDTDVVKAAMDKGKAEGWGKAYDLQSEVRSAAREMGWRVGPQNVGSVALGIPRHTSRVLSRARDIATMSPSELHKKRVNRMKINDNL